MFDRDQFLGLDWDFPTPLNLLALVLIISAIAWLGFWWAWLLINVIPWPTF
jgi:hypothetical protein